MAQAEQGQNVENSQSSAFEGLTRTFEKRDENRPWARLLGYGTLLGSAGAVGLSILAPGTLAAIGTMLGSISLPAGLSLSNISIPALGGIADSVSGIFSGANT